jgi:hypothetical protein
VGLEVLTAVVMKSSVFLDITPCSPLEVSQCFGGTYRLHIQGRRINQARHQRAAGSKHCSTDFNELHGVISRKTELLIFMFDSFINDPDIPVMLIAAVLLFLQWKVHGIGRPTM